MLNNLVNRFCEVLKRSNEVSMTAAMCCGYLIAHFDDPSYKMDNTP